MIDLHCHILPGIDDGAATIDDSLAMARVAVQDGVRTVVATPHGAMDMYGGGDRETRQRVAELNSELVRHEIELQVLPGLEVFLTPDSPAQFDQGFVFTLNGSRYILVEFSLHALPNYAEQMLFELQLRQLVPVIAHPERNSDVAADPSIVARMVERGMLVQLTAGSLLGDFGTRIRMVAEQLVARRLAHIIASDAHSINGRTPTLSGAARRVAEMIGAEAAWAMVTTTPAAIIKDEEVDIPEPRTPRRRSWFPFGRR